MLPLVPSFSGFLEHAQSFRQLIADDDSVVEFATLFCERAILSGSTHLYSDPYLLVQLASGDRGACFLHGGDIQESDLDKCVGEKALDVVSSVPLPIGVALLDGYYSLINRVTDKKPQSVFAFSGTGSDKSMQRAKKIVDLAEIDKHSKVLFIGVIVDLVGSVLEKHAEVRLADFLLAGSDILGCNVHYDASPFIEWADTIIMTGNTLKTNTTEFLLKTISKLGTKLLVYSMTGSNIAPYYLNFGAKIVTAETFPYYWYANLESKMLIYTHT